MVKKITFITKIIIIFLLYINYSVALEVKIIPIKKPIIDQQVKDEKIAKNIIKPKKKPLNDNKEKKVKKPKIKKNLFLKQNLHW